MQEVYDIELDWRGFELHPETPVGGVLLDRVFARDQLEPMIDHIQQVAQSHGLGAMTVGDRLQNTRAALAVAEYAREQGRLTQFREMAMAAVWREGANLEDSAQLAEIARRAGLDSEQALAARSQDRYLAGVDAIRSEARQAGVNSIPTLVFANGQRVVGAKPYPELARVAEAAGVIAK